jgi:hypothetical protein
MGVHTNSLCILIHLEAFRSRCSFLTHSSDIDDLLEGLDGVLEDWLNRLHDTKSSLHIVDLWLHTFDGLHLSSDLNEWLSVIESLEDSSGKGFLDVLDGSGLGNSGGLVVSSLSIEGGVESSLEVGDESGVRHGFELSLLINILDVVVVMVVSGGGNGPT